MQQQQSEFKALKEALSGFDHYLKQIENQGKYTPLEADFILEEIRRLYSHGLAFQDAVHQVSNATQHEQERPLNRENTFPATSQDQQTERDAHQFEAAEPSAKTNHEPEIASNAENTATVTEAKEAPEAVSPESDENEATENQAASDSSGPENEDPSQEALKEASAQTAEPEREHTPVAPEATKAENTENEDSEEPDAASPEALPETNTEETPIARSQAASEQIEDTPDKADSQEAPRGKAVHEKFEGRQTSLHDHLMAENGGQSLADRFKNAPIHDLRSAIGLNERAKFIRELFNGERQTYFDTVTSLNKMNNYKEALNYLEYEVKPVYQWENHQRAVEAFLELVYRRFLSTASTN